MEEEIKRRKHFDDLGNNPLARAEKEIADILRKDSVLSKARCEIFEQNSKALSLLLKRSMAETRGVVIIVGCDRFTNNPPVIEAEMSISAVENVVLNRVNPNSVTALDAILRACEAIDGLDWCMQSVEHETPADGVLRATMTIRGQVYRDAPIVPFAD